jgi:geranylgeranyl diphosphate synthase type I
MMLEKLGAACLPLLDQAFEDSQTKYFPHSPMGEMLSYHYHSGGKRLRPLLVYGAAQAQNPQVKLRDCTPYALAVELLHNATLIHDDIQDGDRIRRDKETLWVKYSLAQAINCGDAWFFVPQLLVQDAGYAPELKLKLMGLLQAKILAVIEGQSQEFALKEKFAKGAKVTRQEYLTMAEGKTSALFSVPLLGGALIGGAGEAELETLEKAALHLGSAFQIQDDLLDLWGNKGRGARGADIAEGKLSYPLVLLLETLQGAELERVQEIVQAPREKTTAAQIEEVIRLMEAKGVRDQAKQVFRDHLAAADARQEWSEITRPLAEWLEKMVDGF